MSKADYSIETADNGRARLILKGQWTITELHGFAVRLRAQLNKAQHIEVDSSQLEALDTAGALLLRTIAGDRIEGDLFKGQDKFAHIYALTETTSNEGVAMDKSSEPARTLWHNPLAGLMVRIGKAMETFWEHFIAQSVFIGHVTTLFLLSIVNPRRIRWPAVVNIMQRAGLEAIPIVTLTNFFVGAVLAFLMVLSLRQYGGAVFAIDFVSIGVLREFAPVIAAVLIAGRSASSFAAEIGAMKMNQEIDAMRVMGIDPYEALVLPRVFALCVMTPLITFLGAIAGMMGGAVVIWAVLQLSPGYFLQRLYDYVPFENFFVGIIRTPVFAATIAIVGCRMGMTVKEDVISLGRKVTTAVVQSIFLVFMIDAMFAILFNGFTF
ncbi:MlaE family lipid ABC transporter permease subunit [Asticcacaulis solisilvae]|uniref:MlaE family lipid ABC transporter permease subunit n=1 Tax=Asticcacaulis solisilvae TaxID=1217274 RepID=UPI003FD735BA